MNFFVDCEATSPEEEIIRISIKDDKGGSFDAIIKPQHSTISPFISELTGLKNNGVGRKIGDVFDDLYHYLFFREPSFSDWHFYCYGDADNRFVANALPDCDKPFGAFICAYISRAMKDLSKDVKKFFGTPLKLSEAYNYLVENDTETTYYTGGKEHDSTFDALMLYAVYEYMQNHEPVKIERKHANRENGFTYPSGRFFVRFNGGKDEHEFATIHDLIDQIIENKVQEEQRDSVHRPRMAIKIMKAVRTKKTYMDMTIRRIKE